MVSVPCKLSKLISWVSYVLAPYKVEPHRLPQVVIFFGLIYFWLPLLLFRVLAIYFLFAVSVYCYLWRYRRFLSLCACECAWLTDQREQLWCGGGWWRTLLADFWIMWTLGHCGLWFLRQWPTARFTWTWITCVVFIFECKLVINCIFLYQNWSLDESVVLLPLNKEPKHWKLN